MFFKSYGASKKNVSQYRLPEPPREPPGGETDQLFAPRADPHLENARWGCCLKFELSGLGDFLWGWGRFGGPPAPKHLIYF